VLLGSRRCNDGCALTPVIDEYIVLAEYMASLHAALNPQRSSPRREASIDEVLTMLVGAVVQR
jgi:hypothetical protein